MKFLTLVALFCVVALSNLANAASCIDTNPSQGSQSILGCSCYSGFTGDDCSVDSVGSCDLPSVAPLTTESIATMGSLNINNKNLLFSLRSPGKSSRYFSVSLNDNQECAYPASAGFTRTFDSNTCEDVFDAQFPVDDIINTCGSIVDAVEGAIEISGTVDITAFDQLDSFRGVSISRSTHSAVSYVITVPTVVNASVDGLSIISAMDVMAAVTFQDYNQTDDTFIIQLVTSVQFPYILNEESFGSSSTSFSVSISRTDDGSQCDDASGPCTQEFEIIVSLDGACEADGDYSFSFFGDCRGQGECPGAGETSASFTIDSDNVCSSVELTAKVSADLESFGDDSFSTPQTAYLPNAQLYFTATVDADVTVSSVSVQEIRVVQNGDPQVIVSGGTQVDPAVSFNANGDGNTVNFIFVAVSSVEGFSIFDANVDDAIFSFDVEVDLEIVYDVTFRKRAVQTKTFTVSRHLVLSPETAVLSPKSSLDNSASAASFTAGSLVAAAVVGVAALF